MERTEDTEKKSGPVRGSESADGGAGAGEAVAAGGTEIFREVEGLKRVGFESGDFGGRSIAEKGAEEGDEAADERAVGFAAEIAAAVAKLADEVDQGDAATDAVRVGALVLGEGREPFCAVNDGAEAFLGVVDDGEVVDELSEFFGEGHGREAEGKASEGETANFR